MTTPAALPALSDIAAPAAVAVGLTLIALISITTWRASRNPATYPPPPWEYDGPFAGVERLRRLLRAHRLGSQRALRTAARDDDPARWSAALDDAAPVMAAMCDDRTREAMLSPALLSYAAPDTCPEFLGAGLGDDGVVVYALAEYAAAGVAAGEMADNIEMLDHIFGAESTVIRPRAGLIVIVVDYRRPLLESDAPDKGVFRASSGELPVKSEMADDEIEHVLESDDDPVQEH